jgi:hypothetical protein
LNTRKPGSDAGLFIVGSCEMKKEKSLSALSIDELVARFRDLAIRQEEALLLFETRKYNVLYAALKAIEAELKGRPGDQRKALRELYSHNQTQVRLTAAKATLAVAPVESRAILREITDSKVTPFALYAGMTLLRLDSGLYTPT